MKVPVIVRLYKGEQLIEVKQFESDQIIIGHNAEVHIDLENESVSPIHAAIEARDSGHFICDLGSHAGTKLNGVTVLDEALKSGDIVEIGGFRLEIYLGVPKPKMKPPSAVAKVPPAMKAPQDDAPTIPTPAVGSSPATQSSPSVSVASVDDKQWGTFSPDSVHRDVLDVLKSSKGPTVEVLVVWGERILSTYHFQKKGVITVGHSPNADITIEAMKRAKQPFLEVGPVSAVIAGPDMRGQLIKDHTRIDLGEYVRAGNFRKVGNQQYIDIQQGEILRANFAVDNIDLYVRYTEKSPPTIAAPMFDFSISEWTGIILSIGLSLLMMLYVDLYAPNQLDKDEEDEVQRIAKFIYKVAPTPRPVPTPAPTPVAKPARPKATPPPVRVKVSDKPRKNKTASKTPNKKKPSPRVAKSGRKGSAGKTGGVRANKNKRRNKKFGSIKKGGATKISKKKSANAKSKKRNVKKMGLFSAFGGGGMRDQLDQSYTGADGLIGMGDRATGTSGQNSNRRGKGIGSRLKAVGGSGTQTEGISGVATKGRGSGNAGYGSGSGGLGDKGRVLVAAGGREERFTGTIDREAVRRVVRAGKRQLQSCYEKELNRNPGLAGKIVVQWEIGEQGRVLKTKTLSSTMGSRKVAQCIQLKIRSWKFPEPPEGVIAVVDFPFVFINTQ